MVKWCFGPQVVIWGLLGAKQYESAKRPSKMGCQKITMKKLIYYDSDLAPRFDDDDDDGKELDPRLIRLQGRNIGGGYGRGGRGGGRDRVSLKVHLDNRRDRQLQRGAGGSATTTAVVMNQIKVVRGAAIGKDFIMRSIGQYIDDVKPLLFRVDRGDITFFVEDDDTAAAIHAISRRVRDPNTNAPITFLLSRVSAGFATISMNERDLIAECLKKRYNAETHALDLSEFGLDELFRSRSLHLSLTRNNIMMAVVDLIDQHYGNVIALSMKGNRLRFLDFFACLLYRIKNVKMLDLSANQIDKESELEKLKGWPVETLFLKTILCVVHIQQQNAIHRVFPKVTMLDGIPVQRSAFYTVPDLDESGKLPLFKPSFYGTDDHRALIEAFIIEFMTAYDDPDVNNRKNLINAYDENATFTMCAENLTDANERSLILIQEKVVYKGAMDIIVALRKLPVTKHLMDTFLVDVSLITDKHMCFAVEGFFRDGLEKVGDDDELRFFCRNFVVVNKGVGKIAVVNDMLFVSGVFMERIQRYKSMITNSLKVPADATVATTNAMGGMSIADGIQSPAALVIQQQGPTPAERAAAGDQQMQQQMVEAFCRESRMKPEWSKKCLIDQNWNYEAAGQAFLAVRDKIPVEAFQ
ncbi:Nuclear RNA export factor 1 [Dirofilaria immitis]|nr:Nuclear RNA export factor 1 [Dirofilaria immitis]